MEIWKKITNYENYEISNHGNVRNVRTKRLLKEIHKQDEYKRVRLYKDSKMTRFRVHRLVAEHFIENKHGKRFVNHIDGNKRNNHVNNLEWCTANENMNHFYMNGGSKYCVPVYLIDDYEEHYFYCMREASRFLNRSNSYIGDLIMREQNIATSKDGKSYVLKIGTSKGEKRGNQTV